MAFGSLRDFIIRLENEGELKRVKAQVSLQYEIGGILRRIFDTKGPSLLLENIEKYNTPIAVGLMSTLKRYSIALETSEDQIGEKWQEALERPIQPKTVNSGPCKEKIHLGVEVDLQEFPIPIWHELDGGPYISLGVCITQDPETGIHNQAIYRLMPQSKNKCGILISPHQHIGLHYAKYEARNEPMPLAVAIGLDPTLYLTAVGELPYGTDHFTVAGGLRKNAVEVVKCETCDLNVPSSAEIIIEGVVQPNLRAPEGPFGEFTGYYGPEGNRPVFEVTAITHRTKPIFQGTTEDKPPTESSLIRGMVKSALLQRALNPIPGIIAVNVAEECCSDFAVIVKMSPLYPGHTRQIMSAIWGTHVGGEAKLVIVVDEDINPFDLGNVMWAVTTRAQFDRDLHTWSSGLGMPLDPSQPSESKAINAKMGIDATRSFKGLSFPTVATPSEETMSKVLSRWDEYGIS